MRTAAAPVTPRPGLAAATRRWWVEHRQQWTAWRIAYLSIVALSLGLPPLARGGDSRVAVAAPKAKAAPKREKTTVSPLAGGDATSGLDDLLA